MKPVRDSRGKEEDTRRKEEGDDDDLDEDDDEEVKVHAEVFMGRRTSLFFLILFLFLSSQPLIIITSPLIKSL